MKIQIILFTLNCLDCCVYQLLYKHLILGVIFFNFKQNVRFFYPLALSKFHQVEVAVWGEISRTLDVFNNELKGHINTLDQRPEIASRWDIWKAEKQKRLLETSEQGISSIAVFETMNKLTPENAVMCVDVGNNAYSFGRYFESTNQDFLMSGYLGSIGFALPAAIGAWAAVGDSRPAIAVAGDGGVCHYLSEITTLVKFT